MVKDKQSRIINESIRRLINSIMDEGVEVETVSASPIPEYIDLEEMKRIAALNIAMMRIIRSVILN